MIKKIVGIISQKTAIRNVAILTLATSLAQALTIFSMPILSRLYTPADFGTVALFNAIVAISATSFTLRYETSILVPEDSSEASKLVILSTLLAVILAAILVVIGCIISEDIFNNFFILGLNDLLAVAFAVGGGVAILTTLQGWLNRQKEYKKIALLRGIQSILALSLAIIAGYFSWPKGLISAQIGSTVIVLILSVWFGRGAIKKWKNYELKATAIKYKNAPKYLLPTSLLDVITLQAPVVLITMWFGESLTGQFSMAWRLLMLPMGLVGAAVGQVFLEKFARSIENKVEAKKILFSTWKWLLLIGIFPMAMVMLYGQEIFRFFLGEEWVESGKIAMILAPMALAILISSPTSGTYLILGEHRFNLFFSGVTTTYRLGALYIASLKANLMLGLGVMVFCEVITILAYQLVAYRILIGRN